MREVELSGYVSAKTSVRTVGDLRELVQWCDKYGVSDNTGVDWDAGTVWLLLTGDRDVSATWIECGDHMDPNRVYDILVETHTHE